MVTWVDVRSWRPEAMEPTIAAIGKAGEELLVQSDEARESSIPAGWIGKGALAAAQKLTRVTDTAELVAAELAAAKRATIDAADAMRGVERGVEEALELAGRHGFTIFDSGQISATPACPTGETDGVAETKLRVRAELVDRVKQTLRHANDIDADLSTVLQRILDGTLVDVTSNNAASGTELSAYVDTGQAIGTRSVLAPPPTGASPSDNAAWWATLSDEERQQLIREKPGLVGSRDGLPAAARDTANREVLTNEHARLEGKLARLEQQLDDTLNGPGSQLERAELEQQIEALKGKVSGIEAIQSRLDHGNDTTSGQQYYLLGIDGHGDGQAIIAKGNPDTSANVATYVPGTGSDLAGIEGGMDRSDRMHRAAIQAGSDPTAVITWYGYDAPDSIVPDAMSDDYARQATDRLTSFQSGLRASHDESLVPSHNTVLGHSYGTTLVGYAAQEGNGLNADEMVFVGSPGVGAEHASALNMPEGHVWATADPDDLVAEAPVLGIDPTEAEFGAQEFDADSAGVNGNWYQGGYNAATHSDYWEPGNPSLDGMGKIIAGKSPE